MKIIGVNLQLMTQDESFQFHSTIMGYYKEAAYPETLVPEKAYFAAIEKYDSALNQIYYSAETRRIKALDKNRDRLYLGIAKVIHAYRLHYDLGVIRAAHALKILLRNFDNPAKLHYPAATSVIYNLSQEFLLPHYAPLVEKIGLTEWVAELKKANEDFDALFNKRSKEQSVLVKKLTITCRLEVEKCYRALMAVTESELIIKSNCPLEKYVDRINEQIATYKKIIAARKTHNAAKRKKKAEGNKDDGEKAGDDSI